MTRANVLVIDGIGANSVRHALARLTAESALDGTTVNVFDRLRDLPRYSATVEARRTPEVVVALRTAACPADAAPKIMDYLGRIAPSGTMPAAERCRSPTQNAATSS